MCWYTPWAFFYTVCHCERRHCHKGNNSTQYWLYACIWQGWGPAGRATPQAKGGTIPKVTRITSPELCPDTPWTFFLSLSLCLRFSFYTSVFHHYKRAARAKRYESLTPSCLLQHLWEGSKERNKSNFPMQQKWGNQHYRTCGEHMGLPLKCCITV